MRGVGPVDARLTVAATPAEALAAVEGAFEGTTRHEVTRVQDSLVVSWYRQPSFLLAWLSGILAGAGGDRGTFVIETAEALSGTAVRIHGRALTLALERVREALEPLGVSVSPEADT